MQRERRRPAWGMGLAALVAVAMPACVGHPNPGCTGPIGLDGRPLPVCDDRNDVPVCDVEAMPTPATRAAFERNELGAWTLERGTLAFCDDDEVVVCANRERTPYCLYKPPS